jgi:hypothetical protein
MWPLAGILGNAGTKLSVRLKPQRSRRPHRRFVELAEVEVDEEGEVGKGDASMRVSIAVIVGAAKSLAFS